MSQTEAQLPIVAERYQLTRMIGRGGMGSVWEGIHVSLGTRVAVKFIDGELAQDHEAQTRFQNEARAAARLQTKHVVQIFDHGLMPDGRPYIVMEYLTGEPLDSRLARERRLPPSEVFRIFSQVAKGLGKAHEVGIVHRDLKPENIFLARSTDGDEEITKVVDFGIAKVTQTGPGISSSTRTGAVIGTPYYMSPEQVRGLRSVDHRTDLWAFAVVVYQCLTGELPYVGESAGDLMVKICVQPPPVPSRVAAVPPGFDAWFLRALAQEPDQRFQTVSEQVAALAVALGVSHAAPASVTPAVSPMAGTAVSLPGAAVTPPPQPPPQHMGTVGSYEVPETPVRSNAPLFVVGGLVLAGALAVGGYFALRGKPPEPPPAPERTAAAPPAASSSQQAVVVAPAATTPGPTPMAATATTAAPEHSAKQNKRVGPAGPGVRPPGPKAGGGGVDLGY